MAADPRTSLAMWLRAGRAERKLTLDDVARVTKIQPRILEKIEAGSLEGLPAAVFVRGFVKSFARCVGLDEGEAVKRYGECENGASSSVARAFVETLVAAPKSEATAPATPRLLVVHAPEIFPDASMEMAALPLLADDEIEISIETEAPAQIAKTAKPVKIEVIETPLIEVIEVVASEEAPKKPKRTRKKAAGTGAPRTRKKKGEVAVEVAVANESGPSEAAPHSETAIEAEAVVAAEPAPQIDPVVARSIFDAPTDEELAAQAASVCVSAADELFAPADGIVIEHDREDDLAQGSEPVVANPWQPTMPPIAPSAPWRRPAHKTSSFAVPSLVIDDSDPDMAERERDDREAATKPGPHRVSFLPPILLDREDKSSRQGGLTLAVILLLIAATLTLSYLMRRPSVSGDGVTRAEIANTTSVA